MIVKPTIEELENITNSSLREYRSCAFGIDIKGFISENDLLELFRRYSLLIHTDGTLHIEQINPSKRLIILTQEEVLDFISENLRDMRDSE